MQIRNPQVSLVQEIHVRAVEVASRYRRAESELLEIVTQVIQHRVYLSQNKPSAFAYLRESLGLSEHVVLNLIAVAKKAREVPALKAAIAEQRISLSNARKITSVLTKENQSEWLTKASELSTRSLEREIARVRPEESVRAQMRYVGGKRVAFQTGLSERDAMKVRKVQDLMSQARRHPVGLEEMLVALLDEYIHRHDPLERAKRQRIRKGSEPMEGAPRKGAPVERAPVTESARHESSELPQERTDLPALLQHQLNLRDERRCTYRDEQGRRCTQTRWLDFHHVIPLSEGGKDILENLVTLCSGHHKIVHLKLQGALVT